MKLIIFLTLLVGASCKMRDACLTANSVCTADDISVVKTPDWDGYELCGDVGSLGAYPTDTSKIPSRGSGKMRKPEDCNGICEYILSDGAREDLVCADTPRDEFTIEQCVQFKNAKQCVPDVGNIFMWIGIGIVLVGLCSCCILHRVRRNRRERQE